TGVLARVAFGKSGVIGPATTAPRRRFQPHDSASWLPWQQDLPHVLSIGVGVGLIASFLASHAGLSVGSDALSFGIATSVLIFLVMGHKVPVTHHIALPAALGVLHGAGFAGGVACGVAGGLIGELGSRVLLIHGDTHVDPPAVGIAAVVSALKVATAMGLIHGLGPV